MSRPLTLCAPLRERATSRRLRRLVLGGSSALLLLACGNEGDRGPDGSGTGGQTSGLGGAVGGASDGMSGPSGGVGAGAGSSVGGGGHVGGSLGAGVGGGGGAVGGAPASGAAPGIGGTILGGSGGRLTLTCEPGAPDTDWPSDCASAARPACTPGTWAVFDPTGADQMPAVREQSEHFVLRWEGGLVSATQAQATLALFEDIWVQIVERIGFAEPFCDSAEKFKVNVHVRPDGGFTGSGVQGVPAMWVEASGIDNRGLLAHEFTHGLQFATGGFRDSPYVGWMWESQADWMNHQQTEYRGNLDCAGQAPSLANFPHLYYGSTRNRYCNWQFWEFLKDKHCYRAISDLWLNAPDLSDPARLTEDPFSVLARNMGWSADELNDFFGDWALHNVTWDYRDPDGTDQGAVYRQAWGYSSVDLSGGSPPGNQRLRVTQLEELDGTPGRYRVPHWWAPQRWGYNLVRLHRTDQGDAEITVSFRGVLQDAAANENFSPYRDVPEVVPAPDSDWRWGLVAVEDSGVPRYSPLQRGSDGELCFQVKGSDQDLWLVVMGTPSSIHKIMWDQKFFSIYRYPWMVQLEGAVPDGFQPDAPPLTANGAPHPNGGGWVAAGASVATTAYVGPHAAVLGGVVTEEARIEDHAIVVDGSVSGSAVVGGLTVLGGGLQVSGNAVLKTTFQSPGTFETGQSLGGTVQVLGDVELRGQALSLNQGVFYGYIEASHVSAPEHGAGQSMPPIEVTRSEVPVWRP